MTKAPSNRRTAMKEWSTLSVEARALQTTCRRCNGLSPAIQRMISSWTRLLHPTANLVKDLECARRPIAGEGGVYRPERLEVASSGGRGSGVFFSGSGVFFIQTLPCWTQCVVKSLRIYFYLSDFDA